MAESVTFDIVLSLFLLYYKTVQNKGYLRDVSAYAVFLYKESSTND